MAASKNAHEAARAKAAKQKKILIGLSPLLFVALFFAYHTMSKLHSSPSATPPPATTPATTPPTATVSTGTPISSTTPAAPNFTPIATPPASSGKLTQLPSLASKDPFHDQGPHATVARAAGSKSKKPAAKSSAKIQKTAVAPPTAAVIAVNGRLMSVAVGMSFPVTKSPATNAIFRLVGLTAKSARIAVVGGSYTSGSHTLTLNVNSVVRLVNTADGKRYTLILYPPGTPVPGAPATTTATQTTTTTGP